MIYLLLILIAIASHWQWTTNLSILTSGDWIYQDPQMLKEFLSLPSIWSTSALGMINIGISFTPFNFIYSILSHWSIDFGFGERLVFMWPILIATPIGSYLLIRNNIPNKLAAVTGSFVYAYNTYFTVIKTGHLTLLAAYSFFPFVLFFYQKALEKKEIKYSLLAGLFGFIVSFYEFRAFYILSFILFFYFLFYIFFIENIKQIKSLIRIIFLAGLPVFIVVLLNLYWLLALGNTGSLVSNTVFNRSLFGNEYLNILQAFSLHHPFWTGARTLIFEVYPIPFYFWVIPIAAFSGLYLNRKNKNVLFFGVIALLGIFLTKQVGQPFQDVYLWLYQNLPGFNAFREASKFYVLIALGYSILIAAFIDWIWNNWKGNGVQYYGKYAITILIMAIFLINLKPIVTGEIGTLFTPRQVPNDYVKLKQFVIDQDNYFRTLWIPTFSRWSIYTNNHPGISSVNAVNGEWREYVGNNLNDKIPLGQLTVDVLRQPYSNSLLDITAVKYIIVPLEDTGNEDNFFVYYYKPRQYYIDELDKITYLQKINIETKEISVYENKNFKPHIYATTEKETIQKNIKHQSVQFNYVSSSEYKIFITNSKEPLYLNFSEIYHPDWKVRIGNVNWINALLDKNYYLSDSIHFQNDAKLNSFIIDPTKICVGNTHCVKHADGSYTFPMTLYFKPQSYVYLGGIISIVTIVSAFGALIFLSRRKKL